MASNKKKRSILKNIFTPNPGCGCGNPKPSDVFHPRPMTKLSSHQILSPFQSSSLNYSKKSGDHSTMDDDEDGRTSTTFSLNIDANSSRCSEPEIDPPRCSKMVSPCLKISDSVAVVKDSNDPYLDFRGSMVQMILEREIYSKDDLLELLNCFLRLNSPSHHEIIYRAFMEIWNGVFMDSPPRDG